MVATASATLSVIVAAASALWRFSHLIDPPVPTCTVHYPEEFPAVVCRCEHETRCEHECLCEHETHCDVRCEDSNTYPLKEDGERTFIIATSSIRARVSLLVSLLGPASAEDELQQFLLPRRLCQIFHVC